MLAGIKAAGGIGALKKVDRSQVRDRSAAIVPGAASDGAGSPPAASGGADGGLAGALAAALNQRKKKVSASGKSLSRYTKCSEADYSQMMRRKMTIGKRPWLDEESFKEHIVCIVVISSGKICRAMSMIPLRACCCS
jgi:hypothetical protein